ncbi:Uma2 family endonuclease [Streptomyces sp. NPDC005549]|uniref:Uma2 family endonuclease n=1 Tax=Streptomyces sp. NPDC005549 TaxID=3154888 RepID=UPI0033B44476
MRDSVAHNLAAERVQRRLYDVIPDEWGVYQRLPLAVPARLGLYAPDLAVVVSAALRAGDEQLIPASRAELVGEITSRATAANDRTHKLAGYAVAGVPLYLLVDGLAPGGPAVTLYGEPEDGTYRVRHSGSVDTAVTLPEPFGCTLEIAWSPAR